MKSVKHCCKNCHFLNKTYRNDRGYEGNSSWSQEERDNLAVKDHYAPSCWRGIWDTGINPGLNAQLPVLLKQNRRDDCFFVEYSPEMSYQGAIELHRLRNDNRQLKKSYRYTQIALGVSATGIVVGVVVNLILNL